MIISDVSGQPISPIFNGQAVQEENFCNYQSSETSQKKEEFTEIVSAKLNVSTCLYQN
jgi:hypothetical protein